VPNESNIERNYAQMTFEKAMR